MRLTLLVLAINAQKELTRILPELSRIGDELVIGIDDATTDATIEVARQFTDRVYPVPHEGFRGRGRPGDLNAVEYMLPHCKGDWLLRVDQDETLSKLWHDKAYVRKLMDDRAATQYWIPRRWVLPPGDRYICTGPWFPDYQLRLYRNIPSLIEFNRRPHSPPRMAGEQRFLSDSWILHWHFIWYDRARWEEKIAFYMELDYPKQDCISWYIAPSEDHQAFRTRCLEYVYPPVVAAESPLNDNPFAATLEILDCPDVMQAGTVEPLLFGVKNRSNRTFFPSSVFVRPANVLLSYHWFTANREIYRWEYARHDLPKSLGPGESASCFVNVMVPELPGDYILQPDLVEEQVSWFSSHCALPSQAVRVL